MRITNTDRNQAGDINGYTLRISWQEVNLWAENWPCSTLSGNSLTVMVDSNGIFDIWVGRSNNSEDIDSAELDAIVSDHLPKEYCHLWPVWGKLQGREDAIITAAQQQSYDLAERSVDSGLGQ